MKEASAMVVLSGGQDSTTCLLQARELYEKVYAISFNYGQRHVRELKAAMAVANWIGVDSHEVVDVRGLLRGRSPLVNVTTDLETYTDFESMDKTIGDRVELTFVPLRNPFFMLVAANYALAKDCYTLVTGVCAMDNANYPDCTPGFLTATEYMMREALGMHRPDYAGRILELKAPLLHLTKAETVKFAMIYAKGEHALSLSHTCYAGEYPPCGKCHACVLRAEGFRLAGVVDPLIEASSQAA